MAHDSLFRKQPAGWATSISAGLSAGALCGALFGTLDALLAALTGSASLGVASFLGCLAASVLHYGALFMLGLAALGLALHPLLRSRARDLTRRYLVLVGAGVALGAFAEIFWWSRPYVFYGRPVLSAERLAAAAGMALLAGGVGWLATRAAMRLSVGASRAIALYLGLCCCGGALFVWVEGRAAAQRGGRNERNGDQPNVLLVVVDALRQDTLGCYGDARVKTPCIDQLAAEGALFENHLTQVPFTWPSFGSLLTGKYPRRHGLVKMAPDLRLPYENVLLPWQLKNGTRRDGRAMQDGDWLAATFHTGTLSAGSGLLRGFDQRLEAMVGHDLVTLDSTWSVFRSELLLFMMRNKLSQRFDNSIVASTAREWLAQHAHERFLAMVHLYSTHTPYDPPAWARELYCDPQYGGPIRAFYSDYVRLLTEGKYVPTPADLRQIRDLYYGGVSHADRMIGSLVEELRKQGVLDQTLVIVTSDHGESLGEEKGEGRLWEHDHMAQTNLRIPLVMRYPAEFPAGTRIAARTEEIDVFPTVLELAHLKLPPQPAEIDKIDGLSLLPLVRGERALQRPLSFAENADFGAAQDDRWKLIADIEFDAPRNPARLYDLAADPGEERDVASEHPQEVARLLEALRAWSKSMPVRKMEHSALDLELQRRFEVLGYTGKDKKPR